MDFDSEPSIYKDKIVCSAETISTNYIVKVYDLTNSTEKVITNYVDHASSPDIYEDQMVWMDDRNMIDIGQWNYDIFILNLSTSKETQITINKSDQVKPAIYGNTIVWTDERNAVTYNDISDIYMCNLSTFKETRLTTVTEEQLAQGIETRITTNKAEQEHPAIYEDKIVWRDWRNGNQHDFINGDIYMYDISTSKETQVTANKSSQLNPDIYKDIIVWEDDRNGGENWDIYMYNLSTKKETQILDTGTNSWQGYPKIYGDRIVWVDTRNGNPDIYMFTLHGSKPTPKPPITDFSATPLSGKVPPKVKFTSTSTGNPTAWKWNFGDGSPLSTEKNPEHIYSKAGVYTVKHTAINAYGRDTEIKTKYINVAAPLKAPVAAFSASPRSGKAPLKVRFTDKSLNSPVSWKWSFGDGTYSTAKNPAHAYSKAGKYNVSLTVKNAKGKNTKIMSGYIVVSKK